MNSARSGVGASGRVRNFVCAQLANTLSPPDNVATLKQVFVVSPIRPHYLVRFLPFQTVEPKKNKWQRCAVVIFSELRRLDLNAHGFFLL